MPNKSRRKPKLSQPLDKGSTDHGKNSPRMGGGFFSRGRHTGLPQNNTRKFVDSERPVSFSGETSSPHNDPKGLNYQHPNSPMFFLEDVSSSQDSLSSYQHPNNPMLFPREFNSSHGGLREPNYQHPENPVSFLRYQHPNNPMLFPREFNSSHGGLREPNYQHPENPVSFLRKTNSPHGDLKGPNHQHPNNPMLFPRESNSPHGGLRELNYQHPENPVSFSGETSSPYGNLKEPNYQYPENPMSFLRYQHPENPALFPREFSSSHGGLKGPNYQYSESPVSFSEESNSSHDSLRELNYLNLESPISFLEEASLSQDDLREPNYPPSESPMFLLEDVSLSQNDLRELDYKNFHVPVLLLSESGGTVDGISIAVEMSHLPDFLRTDIESLVRSNIKLLDPIDTTSDILWDTQWDKNCFKALVIFFSYLRCTGFFLQDFIREDDAAKEKCIGFIGFCKNNIELFERFFPLSKKCKIFVEGLLRIINEDRNISKNKKYENSFIAKYCAFIEILKIFHYIIFDKIFVDSTEFLNELRSREIPRYFAGNFILNEEQNKIYGFFENSIRGIIEGIRYCIKNKKTIEDIKYMKDKMKATAKSTFNKNSICGTDSFLEGIKKYVFKSSHSKLTKSRMEETKDTWMKIKECITNNNTCKIKANFINGDPSLRQLALAVDFLGSIVEEKRDFF